MYLCIIMYHYVHGVGFWKTLVLYQDISYHSSIYEYIEQEIEL